MSESIRRLAYQVAVRRDNINKLKNLKAPPELIYDASERYEIAMVEFYNYADVLGISNDQKHELLQENEEYLKVKRMLSELFPQMPTARLFKKLFDYQYRWCFSGGELKGEDDTEEDDELANLNQMTVPELEEFIDTNPEPEEAMRALGILANAANEWSVDLLIEFHILADRVKRYDQENISKDEIVQMINETLHLFEDGLIE